MNRLLALLAALAGLLTAAFAWAQAPSATLTHAAGTVYMTSAQGTLRAAVVGAALERGESVATDRDSYAKLQFVDGTEILLRPGSRVTVENMGYRSTDPSEDGFVMRLVKGGLRAVTGQVGRTNPDRWQVITPTAAIGIRGTVFDLLYCQRDCTGGADGLYTAAIEDPHYLRNQAGNFPVAPGQSVYLRDAQSRPVVLPIRCGLTFPDDFVRRAPGPAVSPNCVLR